MNRAGEVLIVDDDKSMCAMLESGLSAAGFQTTSKNGGAAALDIVREQDVDVVVTDLRMSGLDGIELCRQLTASRPDVPVIVITAFGSMEQAVLALRAGAYDFVTKPFDLETIRASVRRAAERRALIRTVHQLERALRDANQQTRIVGKSEPMRRMLDLMERVARSDAGVLITGESGTGKELVAQTLHERSRRKDGPFVAINCAAVPESLLESELFGHMKGAFTDARSDRTGLFHQADRGTLFLDEVGELPLALQPKLLRAIQERKARPLGGKSELPFDVRVIAATNVDLEEHVKAGRFREDLYYRLQVVEVEVPPLRDRGDDVLLLAQSFIERFAAGAGKEVTGLVPDAAEKLLAYDWPGNVRELANCIERAVLLSQLSKITAEDLPDRIRALGASVVPPTTTPVESLPTMDEIEKRYVHQVFKAVKGNKSLAANVLGFNRKTLYRKLRKFGEPALDA